MKKRIAIILIAALGFLSCNSSDQAEGKKQEAELREQETDTIETKISAEAKTIPLDPVTEIGKLNKILKKYDDKSQVFSVSSGEPTTVTGKKGTIINVVPANLETENGQPLGKEVEVELKELTSQSDMLRANAQTVCNGNLLVSGGAYFINIKSDGHKIRIKKGKSLKVEFPKLTDANMSLFYGQRDSLGQMNWEKSGEEFVKKKNVLKDTLKRIYRVPKDRLRSVIRTGTVDYILASDSILSSMSAAEQQELSKEKGTYDKVYAAINISSLGWFNCDAFLDKPKTELIVKFAPNDSVYYANVYLVFKSLKSVLQSMFVQRKGNIYNEGFKNVPVGYEVRLIAYTVKNDNVYAYASDIKIEPDQIITPELRLTSEAEFKNILTGN